MLLRFFPFDLILYQPDVFGCERLSQHRSENWATERIGKAIGTELENQLWQDITLASQARILQVKTL